MMEGEDQATVAEIISGFTDVTLKGSRDILLELLINKSTENLAEFDSQLIDSTFKICMEHLSSPSKKLWRVTDLCLSLICNLTVLEENSKIFLDTYTTGSMESIGLKPNFSLVVESFLNYDSQLLEVADDISVEHSMEPSSASKTDETWNEKDPWQHVSSILCNLVRLDGGRHLLLKRSFGYMQKLVKQIRSRNPVRRRGAVASIRTCLFDNEIHWWFLHEVGALPFIMMPIVVSTPFTDMEKIGMDPILWLNAEDPLKKWEPEIDILIMLLECIILLCLKRGIREELRKRQVYPMCRNLDYLQDDESVSNLILEIVNLLMRDEHPDTPIDSDSAQFSTNLKAQLALTNQEVLSDKTTSSEATIVERKNFANGMENPMDGNYLDFVD
jgi:Domain of unknown function (DUF383)/Domain of unknown function (DUF384)